MSFFKNMSLERVFIVLSLIGALALTYMGYGTKGELDELRTALTDKQKGVPAVANELQQLSLKHSTLWDTMKGEGFVGQEGVESYIRRHAASSNARIGQIVITHNANEIDRKTGIVDHVYTIKTQNSDATLGRRNIVSFLTLLENDSQQMRVTNINLRPSRKNRTKPHEIPPDAWLFDAVCTSRVKSDA